MLLWKMLQDYFTKKQSSWKLIFYEGRHQAENQTFLLFI